MKDWREKIWEKYGDKGDDRYGFVKHNNTILDNILNDVQDILATRESELRKEWAGRIEALKIKRKYVEDNGTVSLKEQGCKTNTALNQVLKLLEPDTTA